MPPERKAPKQSGHRHPLLRFPRPDRRKNAEWNPANLLCYPVPMKRLLLTTIALMTALPLYAELRTFKNTKGEEIKAEMVNATDSHVELKREDGRKFLVPLASLSEADRTWIAEWR